ncbi:MAG: phosphatase PAP2 family protein [Candidatus Margulisbacteria bacterium]|nr:phosphatase PAP2 family protein [Candidatus Margulisiibacteriota bacterium]
MRFIVVFFICLGLTVRITNAYDKVHDDPLSLAANQIRVAPQELLGILTYPINHPNETWLFTGTTLTLIAVDRPTTQFVQEHINPLFDSKINYPQAFDLAPGVAGVNGALFVGAGLSYVTGVFLEDSKLQLAAFGVTKAFAYSYLSSHIILKTLFARSRPDPNLGAGGNTPEEFTRNPWEFGQYHPIYIQSETKGTAFPSFHFTAYFAVAKVLQRLYGDWIIPYGICAVGLLPDFKGHNHWVSDMVAGAWIGTTIGDQIADQSFSTKPQKQPEAMTPAFLLQPMITPDGGIGIQALTTFDQTPLSVMGIF